MKVNDWLIFMVSKHKHSHSAILFIKIFTRPQNRENCETGTPYKTANDFITAKQNATGAKITTNTHK